MSEYSQSFSSDDISVGDQVPLHGKLMANFSPSRADVSENGMKRKDSKILYREVSSINNAEIQLNRLIPKEQLEDYKHIVENNILKYIALGFSKALKEKEAPKPLYDTELGLVKGINQEFKGNAVT